MAKTRTKRAHDRTRFETENGDGYLDVIGGRPKYEPYLWIGRDDPYVFLGTLNEVQMHELRDTITRALGEQ